MSRFHEVLSSPHYERLRSRLIRIFARRGCSGPEELADETITRVVKRLDDFAPGYEGDPVRYFFGVARNVYLEHLREPVFAPLEFEPGDPDVGAEGREVSRMECLERCLIGLDPPERDLITEYYQHDKSAKIDHRKNLATRQGLGINALRIRVHRIRRRLAQCVSACLAGGEPQ